MSGSSTGPADEAAEWHRVAEERRRQLERLQDQTLYWTAAAALGRGRRIARRLRSRMDPLRDGGVRIVRSARAAPKRLRARARIAAVRESLAALPPAPDGAARRAEVTAVIVSASQPQRLDALLAALGRLGVTALVVDNAGVAHNATVVARHPHAQRLRLDRPVNFAQANEHAIAQVTTPWILLLNDDVEPLDEHWLDRMLAAADTTTVAVGAQLVHGPRGLLGGDAVDGTVQHAGIGFVLDGPLARPEHLDRGAPPVVRSEVRDVVAATAACLLVRTAAHRAVGGLHAGFDYGSEDVDLCLRLAAHGAVRVALGAVLQHEEGATRLSARGGVGRRVRMARQVANRALLDARHAPQLRRDVVRAAFAAGPVALPVRVAVAVAGAVPAGLRDMLAEHPALALVTGRPGAVTIVTDPARLPAADSAGAAVPIVGWITARDSGSPTRPSGWSREALEWLDLLLIEGDGAPAASSLPLTLPPTLRARGIDGSVASITGSIAAALEAPRWSVRTGVPAGRGAELWGDTPVAKALAGELRSHGLIVRVVGRDAWGGAVDRAADVTLQLKGRGVAPVAEAQTNLLWVISHPSEVAPGELDAVDHVIAGSTMLAERYRGLTTTPVTMLPQATDARLFGPGPHDASVASRVLFIGNTRSVPRPVVLGAVDAGLPLTLIGSGWERYLDPSLVSRAHVPFDELAGWYRSAEVVLNDHWDDMARWGLVSNRIYDVLACGGCVVSDEVEGMAALLDDAIVTVRDRSEVGPVVQRLLADPVERAERAARGQRAVLAGHTWEQRAIALVSLVGQGG
jgi:GT2 family glycosyltransferase